MSFKGLDDVRARVSSIMAGGGGTPDRPCLSAFAARIILEVKDSVMDSHLRADDGRLIGLEPCPVNKGKIAAGNGQAPVGWYWWASPVNLTRPPRRG